MKGVYSIRLPSSLVSPLPVRAFGLDAASSSFGFFVGGVVWSCGHSLFAPALAFTLPSLIVAFLPFVRMLVLSRLVSGSGGNLERSLLFFRESLGAPVASARMWWWWFLYHPFILLRLELRPVLRLRDWKSLKHNKSSRSFMVLTYVLTRVQKSKACCWGHD
ncbi:hypothetical protein BC835DRAFT_264871 [Cytidiella melzeri]|nr:hypothetical protein BC835DRAFT_264871 [Cytidiella melzeri]